MQQERQQQRFGGLRVAIAVDDDSHKGECTALKEALEELGAVPLLLARKRGQVGGDLAKQAPGQAQTIEALSTLALASAEDLDALVVPGGSSQLVKDPALQALAREIQQLQKPLALSGAGVSLLLVTNLAAGRRLTGPPKLAEEAQAAGAQWSDGPAVNDGMLVTGRGTDDMPAFIELLLDVLAQHRLQGQGAPANDIISATGEDG